MRLARRLRSFGLLMLVCVALGFGSADAHASSMPSPVVDIKTCASASGRYALEVDPTELYGRGQGWYRLTLDGREVWNKMLPFTLHEAAVLNDGTCVGYAYDHGYEGFAVEGGFKAGMGNLQVVILDPQGRVRLHEVTPRKYSMIPHAPAEPVVRGMIVHEDQDRLTIRVWAGEGERWWSYRCSTGKRLKRFDLRKAAAPPESARWVREARAVPGTPLSLIRWSVNDPAKESPSALFMLVDEEGKSVWSREEPLQGGASPVQEETLRALIDRHGLILQPSNPGQFELWLIAQGQKVAFSVTRNEAPNAGWRVGDQGREPYAPAAGVEPVMPPIEQRALPSLGRFRLAGAESTSPLRAIWSFDFDSEGRIGVIQKEGEVFTLLDSAGTVLAEVPLPKTAYDAELDRVRAAPVGGGAWILVASESGQEARSWAWRFDPAEKRLGKPLPLTCPDIDAVAGDGQGGFVILAARRSSSSLTMELQAFNREGARLWVQTQNYDKKPESLFSPKDVTVTTRQQVAVLDVICHTVQLFDLGGKYLRTVNLEKSWGWKPNYPSGIMADLDGGFVVEDFHGKSPFVRMQANGAVREPVRPRRRDGRLVDPNGSLHVAPDGRVWTCDGQALLRLDAKGVVDFTLGEEPDLDALGKIATIAAGPQSRLYAVDERTGAVHVFDLEGRKRSVCKPAPGDFKENLRQAHVTVADDGNVYLGADEDVSARPGVLHFGPDGARLGFQNFQITTRQEWNAQPGTNRLLIHVYQSAGLVEPDGKLVKAIQRRANRRWLDSILETAIAPDGSFAIQSASSVRFAGDPAVTLFTRDGDPVRTLEQPPGYAALLGFNGTHLVFRRGDRIEIFDRDGKPVQAFAAPQGNEWGAVLARDGRELWIVDFAQRTVERLAMP